MARRGIVAVAVLALGAGAGAAPAEPAKNPTRYVRSDAAFAAAVARFRHSGGRIVLLPGSYRRLVIGPRSSRPLRIVGRRGARVGGVRFEGTQRVSLGRVVVAPVAGDAEVGVWGSRHVVLHDLRVTAHRTRHSASIVVADAAHVRIQRSDFSHCGDHDPEFVNCVTLYRWARHVVIEDNRFHDCFGCDFVNGRFAADLTIRGNRFERALPCRMGRYRCHHNDLVQLFGGWRLLVVRNRFGVYRSGGAQLYLTNAVDHATIVNNVFLGTDAKVPGYRARMGIVVGSRRTQRMPLYTRILNNTILTGERRVDGYAGSIRMSTRYGVVRRAQRPIVANNVIGLLETPGRVCGFAQRFVANLVVRGHGCSPDDIVGPVDLDRLGRPTSTSPVIDLASRRYAPPRDAAGRPRDGPPDVGAYEFRLTG
jgi:hypothetical protein